MVLRQTLWPHVQSWSPSLTRPTPAVPLFISFWLNFPEPFMANTNKHARSHIFALYSTKTARAPCFARPWQQTWKLLLICPCRSGESAGGTLQGRAEGSGAARALEAWQWLDFLGIDHFGILGRKGGRKRNAKPRPRLRAWPAGHILDWILPIPCAILSQLPIFLETSSWNNGLCRRD